MKTSAVFKSAVFVLAIVLAFAICSAQAAEVKIQGELNNDGKGIAGDNGKQYTIIPAEEMEGKLSSLEGKRVELSGVVYQSHGRDMITAFTFKVLP